MPSLSYRPGSSRFVVCALVLCGLGWGANFAPAQAQVQTGATTPTRAAPEFLLNRFTPATPGSDWFVLESLDFRGHLRPAVRLGFDWSQKPFVLEDRSRESLGAVVERQVFLHLGLGLTLFERVRLAVDLPIAVDQDGTASPRVGGVAYPDPGGATVGDVRVSLDVRLFGQYGQPFVLAVGAHLFIPTVTEPYTTDAIVRVMPRLMMAGQAGLFAYALDFAFLSRDRIADRWFQGYGIGHELFAGAAVGIKPVPTLLLGAELVAFSKLSDGDFLQEALDPGGIAVWRASAHRRSAARGGGRGPGHHAQQGLARGAFPGPAGLVPLPQPPAARRRWRRSPRRRGHLPATSGRAHG